MQTKERFALMSAKVKFLSKEKEVITEIATEATSLFQKAFLEKVDIDYSGPQNSSSLDIKRGCLNPPPIEEVEAEEESELSEEKKALKKVYVKVALIAHPDKLVGKSDFEIEYKTALFRAAQQSYESEDYGTLVEVAEQLNIPIPEPTEAHLNLLANTINSLQEEIKIIRSTYSWVWYHKKDKKSKDELMEKYIERIKEKNSRN